MRVFSFARPKRGSGLGNLPADMPRGLYTWVSLCNLMLKICGILHSPTLLGSDSPQSNNSKGNSIHPT